MPIAFSCACGKSFQVKDEFTGKRTKCPTCGAGLTVPESTAPVSAEDEAFRMLDDGPEPDQPARLPRRDWGNEVEAAPPPPPAAPKPGTKPTPAPKKPRPPRESREEGSGGGFRISLSPAVGGGLASMLIGGVIIAVSLGSGRIPIGAIIVFFFGLVAVVKGLLGHGEE
ncbi:MAG: hypothetical protein JWO38_7297 [Gemmataceae bacterium]|nr:hypothetical protein [Gemmataceae bacterium]